MVKAKPRFEIRPMKIGDIDEVAYLLAEVFSKKETISSFFREKFNEKVEDLFEYYAKPETEKSFKENMCFVCVDTSLSEKNQIIGYTLCRALSLDDTNEINGDQFHLEDAFESLSRECQLRYLKLYPNTKESDHLWGVAVGVKDGYERQGIAMSLMECSMNKAKKNGFKYVYFVFTTKAHSAMSKKMNLRPLFSIPYAEIEYKGIKFLKDITVSDAIYCYNKDFDDWELVEEKTHFD